MIENEWVVQAHGLAQGYGRVDVFSELDLDLSEGVFGLLGPNGAGKTTLLRTLATIAPPRRGSLTIAGRPVTGARTARHARRCIGYLPQHFGFFGSHTVYEFVRYCAWLRCVPAEAAHEAAVSAIAAVNLLDQQDARMKSLSGGMVRRCGLAQALVGQPRLVLLDEPTVGLDPAQRLEFRRLIRSLTEVTVLLSTHLVEDVAATCDEAIVFAGGRVEFRGSPDALAARGDAAAAGDSPLERGYSAVLDRRVAA